MTKSIKVICPECQKSLKGATDEMIGDVGVCPKCKAEFIIEDTDKPSGQTSELEASNNPIQQDEHKKSYGGIRRREFFFGWVGILVFNIFLGLVFQGNVIIYPARVLISLAVMGGLIIARLENIGKNGWWALLMVLPVVNLFVAIPCFMCPEGHQDTKKLDTAGKIIAGILIGVGVFVTICILMTIIFR